MLARTTHFFSFLLAGTQYLVDGRWFIQRSGAPRRNVWTRSRRRSVSTYLWSRGFKRIDVVAPPHAHQDHIGGLTAIFANFMVNTLSFAGRNNRETWLDGGNEVRNSRVFAAASPGRRKLRERNATGKTSESSSVKIKMVSWQLVNHLRAV